MRVWRYLHSIKPLPRCFSTSARRLEIRNLTELPPRIHPAVKETSNTTLLSLQWPTAPRNILIVRKDDDDESQEALLEYAHHIHSSYPSTSLILESHLAQEVHKHFSFPVYTPEEGNGNTLYQEKVDLTSTLGGDGTILHAASLFASAQSVPPILSFSMGTLGFLGEWKFREFERAFREVYHSSAPASKTGGENDASKTPAPARNSRILMRNRLRMGIFSTSTGERLPYSTPTFPPTSATSSEDIFALNEVLLHRGALPHLAHITILIGSPPHQRTLTTAIADGFLVSTPTGSTAYSLSSGGSIVHPLVSSLLLTPICPRSLSFRPLVLPANTPVTLRIEAENRAKEIEVSVDGVRRPQGLKASMEVRVVGEELATTPGGGKGRGGVPVVVRSGGGEGEGEDHWVGGLNELLKFNYPFGEGG